MRFVRLEARPRRASSPGLALRAGPSAAWRAVAASFNAWRCDGGAAITTVYEV
ncbi:MAG: hypothetical protein U0031_16875 [Thermomicrobiales bacterium]